MNVIKPGAKALRAEARLLLESLRDRRLLASLGIFLALLVLAAQAPLRYAIEIGNEEGYGSDRPIVADFHDPEISPSTGSNFRWTTERSLIRLPGVGQRPLQLRLRLLPVNPEVAARGPKELEVWAGGQPIGRLAIRPASGGIYRLLVPAPRDGSGDQEIELRGTTFTPTGDPRAIGAPIDAALIESAAGPVWPAWGSTLLWLIGALLLWLGLRRAGLAPNTALIGLALGILLASLAALLDPPRFAFGATPALIALALGWLLMLLLNAAPAALLLAGSTLALPAAGLLAVLGTGEYENWGGPGAVALGLAAALMLAGWLRPALGTLYRRIVPPIAPAARRWLMLMALLVLAARYGGKIYPDAMWGDIGFHTNRYTDVLQGVVLLLSRNRGVDFPYPPAFYLLIAPFALLGLDKRVLLQLGGALLDAASPFLVYTLAVCGLARAPRDQVTRREQRTGLIAAGIYSFSASGYMITWWNFSTHTFSQFAHLLLITVLVALLPSTTDPSTPRFLSVSKGRAGDRPFAAAVPERVEGQGRRPTLRRRSGQATDDRTLVPWSVVGGRWSVLGGLFLLQSLVYVGHFGFWINMTLLGGMGLAALLIATIRARRGWGGFWVLLAAFVAAELFAVLLYYGAYTSLFIAQAQATASGGLTGLANRRPTDRALLWNNLWDNGFRIHFGFFPVPLALCGLALLWGRTTLRHRSEQATDPSTPRFLSVSKGRAGERPFDAAVPERVEGQGRRPTTDDGHKLRSVVSGRWSVVVLMVGTFLIALLFGSLPFITGSTLSTRWLMFSAWAIAIGAALIADLLWRTGRGGRWLLFAMGGYILWITASQWLGALAWRIRPPEPF